MKISKEVYPHNLVEVQDIRYITLASGKSGTSSMVRTVNEYLGHCIHTHGNSEFMKVHTPPGSHYSLAQLIRDIRIFQGAVTIFSVYREPLARIISNTFQFGMLDGYDNKNAVFSELIRDFTEGELGHLIECPHETPSFFGEIDIYRQPFDFDRGYTRYENGAVGVYFFLFSRIDDWGRQLSEIFGKTVIPARTNITVHPGYTPFLEQLRIGRKDLEKIYNRTSRDLDYFMQIASADEYSAYISDLFKTRHGNDGVIV